MPPSLRHENRIALQKSFYVPLLEILDLDEEMFQQRKAIDGSVGGRGKIDANVAPHSPYLDSTSFRAHLKELTLGSTLCLQNGQQPQSAFLVRVNGHGSNIRNSFLPNIRLDAWPFATFNERRQIKRTDFDERYNPAIGESSIIQARIGDIVLHISVNDFVGQNVNISWIYFCPDRGTSDPLYKANRPVSRAMDIPEEFYEEIKAISGLKITFSDVFGTDKPQMERHLH
ncbi:hypothetical protein QQS21_007538 [Conoideocrella luteorostrata]|uniref:Uncharacterized protein n=1 Tax=Conoideocrella luteorostrata TaxID=1105319 RepID=A0AAJ0CKH2_9HYPO|nr:hypothetical protein QQS21_007538 [Conoideocrella luteorostrata]